MKGNVKPMFTDENTLHWQSMYSDMQRDEKFLAERRSAYTKRERAVKEMRDLLEKYMTGQIDNKELRHTFQVKTNTDWKTFGLGGFSGAMFLNMLVNNIPDQEKLKLQLQAVLLMPNSAEDGKKRLSQFVEYLRELDRRGVVPKRKLQPTSAPFFVSSWWHIQSVEEYPIFYRSSRSVLEHEGLLQPTDELVRSYFEYREAVLKVAQALKLSIWEFESLCLWYEQDSGEVVEPQLRDEKVGIVGIPAESDEPLPTAKEATAHTHIQWLLARIGQKLGLKVWIASNDRRHTWQGESLGKYSIDRFPPLIGIGEKSRQMIELIDVVWLQGTKIVAGFEVESTTSIYSGLLRLSDLIIALGNFQFPIYIAVPDSRITHVREQLSRLTFQQLEVHHRCYFFSFENLIEDADAIMRFAKDTSAMSTISQRVGDIDQEGY